MKQDFSLAGRSHRHVHEHQNGVPLRGTDKTPCKLYKSSFEDMQITINDVKWKLQITIKSRQVMSVEFLLGCFEALLETSESMKSQD